MTLVELWEYVRTGGAVAMLIVATYGGYKEWYVWGVQYRRVLAERDAWKKDSEKWQNIALRSVGVNEKMIRLAADSSTIGESP